MDISKIEKRLAREQAKLREAARKAQALGAELSRAKRSTDTRRKVLAGVWALDQADRSKSFEARMLRDLDRFWLYHDKDRQTFGLDVLPGEEKALRKAALDQYRETKASKRDAAALGATPVAGTCGDHVPDAVNPASEAESPETHETEAA
jgi:hypothetical protein